jgi:transcriptional regulator of nitric oxide reductase
MSNLDILELVRKLESEIEGLKLREHRHPIINLGVPVELTIAAGIVIRTRSNHTIDTQADAATDDLDTINGGKEGDLLFLRAANSARTVVVKDGTGNLRLAGDFTMDHADDVLELYFDGTNWLEVSGSANTT